MIFHSQPSRSPKHPSLPPPKLKHVSYLPRASLVSVKHFLGGPHTCTFHHYCSKTLSRARTEFTVILTPNKQHSLKYSFMWCPILDNQLWHLLDSKSLRWLNEPISHRVQNLDQTVLAIGSVPSKHYPEAFCVGHYKDLTKTTNHA